MIRLYLKNGDVVTSERATGVLKEYLGSDRWEYRLFQDGRGIIGRFDADEVAGYLEGED